MLDLLRAHPSGLTDAEIARRLGKIHQHVNQTCRALAAARLINRIQVDGQIMNRLVIGAASPPPTTRAVPLALPRDPGADWASEAQVVLALAEVLERDGWEIERIADTGSGERGVDLQARRGTERLLVEAKGYPDTTYARGVKAGQPKPTQPTLQAGHYFDGGLRKCLQMRESDPDGRVVLALPDLPRFRKLTGSVASALRHSRVEVWSVDERGAVTTSTTSVRS